MKPSEEAEGKLLNAQRNFEIALNREEKHQVGMMLIGLGHLAAGLRSVNTGIRATYLKLEELETLIKRQGGPNRP